MPTCYYPIDGWRSKKLNENRKRPVVFNRAAAQQDDAVKLPCGRCIGCRLENARQWSIRCVHEATQHDQNCFITLTYNDENLPSDWSLDKKDWQDFWRRLKYAAPGKIRMMMAGEYGENQNPETRITTLGRPHFHAIVFGMDFNDRKPHKKTPSGEILDTSETLDQIWGKGFASVGSVTRNSANYVARYITKKITGDEAESHYQWIHAVTGEVTNVNPEFSLSSKNPGIGAAWFHKYKDDMRKGFLMIDGVKQDIPKYYKRLYAEHYGDEWASIAAEKAAAIDQLDPDNTLDRLRVKEEVKQIRTKTLKRGKVNETSNV